MLYSIIQVKNLVASHILLDRIFFVHLYCLTNKIFLGIAFIDPDTIFFKLLWGNKRAHPFSRESP